ncbi:hypothetical protein C100_14970 [Sphingobium sp. C100]|uniref:hypothetical protein n=1 Tax=Sphingobium sp. C100 TaxID=1207055 RepID=UPI0003D5FB74|nr:hypothetical protein [Sphingobium sp. C100]ETI63007.1 hypothetical protein C100_14970 [Sphingobium sp. C100]
MTGAPSRYSIEDRDYDPALGCRLHIELNGIRQDKVIAYDAEAGWVDRHEVDAAGLPVIDRTRETISVERVTGLVAVTLLPEGGGSKV